MPTSKQYDMLGSRLPDTRTGSKAIQNRNSLKHTRNEYMRNEYMRNEYMRNEYMRNEYMRNEYMRNEYMRNEYMRICDGSGSGR
jgi:hypothetical protein